MLVFKNEGMIPIEAFTTFGVNAKPATDSPIGYFGTGLKYAVAVTIRLGGTVEVYRGEEQYVFNAKEMDFRGKGFTSIRMKRRQDWLSRWRYDQLPFTTELGKNWEPWMAVRELESNVRDENGFSLIEPDGNDYVVEGGDTTTIIVRCPEMEEAYTNETIFMPLKPKLFENGMIEVYEGESKYVFYRGLRIRELEKPSLFTYNFTVGVTLTEDRTSKFPHNDDYNIAETWMRCTDQKLLGQIMDLKDEKYYEEYLPFDQHWMTPKETFLGEMGARAALGHSIMPRIYSYYKKTKVESDPETKIKISLRKKDILLIKEWADNNKHEAIARACRVAIQDMDIDEDSADSSDDGEIPS